MKTVKTEKGRLGTTNGKLTGTRDAPVEVGEGARGLVAEESEESEGIGMADMPPVEVGEGARGLVAEESEESEGIGMADMPSAAGNEARRSATLAKEESQEGLFVSDDSGEENFDVYQMPSSKNKGKRAVGEEDDGGEDDKKKLGMNTTYDGFSIYGRILCLVVKRRGTAKGKELAGGAGQAMMEEWITSTQMGEGQMMDE